MPPVTATTCSVSALIGTWVPVKSEIPGYDLSSEIYHFTADQHFLWEFPHLVGQPTVTRYCYELDGLTLTYRSPRGDGGGITISAWFEGNLLVFQPPHGCKTSSRRSPSLQEISEGGA